MGDQSEYTYVITILAIVTIGALLYGAYDITKVIINYFFKEHINKHLLVKQLKPVYKQILIDQFHYYQQLDEDDKTTFEKRVQKFINMKKFVGRGQIQEVTSEMKVLIAASAIQLTFGYPGVYFTHFWKVILYDTNYYSSITNRYHQGEVNTRGFIILSWENFVHGYHPSTAGRNLGLHEMAHALKIENAIMNEEYDFIDSSQLKIFYKFAGEEIAKIREDGSAFFRSYAGTNIHEFFAISIENFFERPHEFKSYHPELYEITSTIMKQDPCNMLLPTPKSPKI